MFTHVNVREIDRKVVLNLLLSALREILDESSEGRLLREWWRVPWACGTMQQWREGETAIVGEWAWEKKIAPFCLFPL